ncbi:hypothetical protein CANARDRAFT_26812 [[Candida] arabinofermentans NRRL YB-2248]|uniref:Rab-GAP TBC domain-containing protein n=1 Tax=[Candida] arabinofermentans NRRL YB-2248 TaxID=983967 RepID=A0A1E4T6S6_9ASCO|nr:hypothetical protein CANARDRAFT_26812 [[Candida] arabinofermentans NRRL YB-2248]
MEHKRDLSRKSSHSKMRTSTSSHRLLNRKASTLSSVERKGRKKDSIERFLESDQTVILSSLSQLRYSILCEGLPRNGDESCPYRVYVWSILLRAEPIETDYYVSLVQHGESNSFTKIHNDAFRTFKKDQTFSDKVSNGLLIRILNSYANEIELIHPNNSNLSPYVQGMNILLAPIAYISKSEPEAFCLFKRLLTKIIPMYVTPNLSGVLNGVKLVDIILELVDSKLFNHLKSKMLSAKIYALPSVLTLGACTPPLSEVLELWDFLFSYGVHLNIFFIISQVILIREDLLASKNPMTLLREFPKLEAKKVVKLSMSFVKAIPTDLYDLVVRHTWDPSIDDQIDEYDITGRNRS